MEQPWALQPPGEGDLSATRQPRVAQGAARLASGGRAVQAGVLTLQAAPGLGADVMVEAAQAVPAEVVPHREPDERCPRRV